ncbi:hypothetical protein HMSSN036_36060 [Paenibacillus macerans]|nr:hypothetical protein HMSSN036_36060 [Paenibacillus macerans]
MHEAHTAVRAEARGSFAGTWRSTPDQLLEELSKIIPAENDEWIKMKGASMLTSGAVLDYYHLLKNGKVHVRVKRDNRVIPNRK